MFGWDIHNSKSDRIKLFCFILVVFLVIGFTATFIFRSLGTDAGAEVSESRGGADSAKNVDSVTSSKTVDAPAMDKNKYDQNGVPVAKRGKHTLSKNPHKKSRFPYSKEFGFFINSNNLNKKRWV
ncbi:TPA: hypothetical protein VJR00_001730 [Streptococcus pyogenes]|nr:hypothetical protein [Streptococcus pyogenes]